MSEKIISVRTDTKQSVDSWDKYANAVKNANQELSSADSLIGAVQSSSRKMSAALSEATAASAGYGKSLESLAGLDFGNLEGGVEGVNAALDGMSKRNSALKAQASLMQEYELKARGAKNVVEQMMRMSDAGATEEAISATVAEMIALEKEGEKVLDTIEEIAKASKRIDLDDAKSDLSDLDNTGTSAFSNLTSGVSKFASGALAAVGSVAAIRSGIELLGESFNEAMDFRGSERTLAQVAGSAAEAEAMLSRLRDTSDRLGIRLSDQVGNFANLANAVSGNAKLYGELENIFEGVATMSTALGKSGEQTTGILEAMAQMAQKTKIETEELKQIAERGVPVFEDLSRGLGITTEELLNQIKTGKLLKDDVLPALANVWKEKYGKSAEQASKQASGSLNVMRNDLDEIKRQVGNDIAPAFNELAQTISSSIRENKDEIVQLSQAIGVVASGIVTAIGYAVEFGSVLKEIVTIGGLLTAPFSSSGIEEEIAGITASTREWRDALNQAYQAMKSGDSARISASIATLNVELEESRARAEASSLAARGYASDLKSIADEAGLSASQLSEWASKAKDSEIMGGAAAIEIKQLASNLNESKSDSATANIEIKQLERTLDELKRTTSETSTTTREFSTVFSGIDTTSYVASVYGQIELYELMRFAVDELGASSESAMGAAQAMLDVQSDGGTRDEALSVASAFISAKEEAENAEKAFNDALAASQSAALADQRLPSSPNFIPLEPYTDPGQQAQETSERKAKESLDHVINELDEMGRAVDKTQAPIENFSNQLMASSDNLQLVGNALMGLADIMWDSGNEFASVIGHLGNAIAVANDPNATDQQKAQSYGSLTAAGLGAVFGTGQQTTQFGGENSDYSMQAAELGGQIFGPTGAIFGFVLGSFFKNVDKALIEVEKDADGKADAVIKKADGGLSKIAGVIEQTVENFLFGFEDTFGVALESAGAQISIKGDLIAVEIDGAIAHFKTLEGAMDFFVERTLEYNRDFEGFSEQFGENFQRFLGGLKKGSLEGTGEDVRGAIALAYRADTLAETGSLPERQRAAEVVGAGVDIMADFSRNMELAYQFGLDFSTVIDITEANIGDLYRTVESGFANLLGVRDIAGPVNDLVAQYEAFNDANSSFYDERVRKIAEYESRALELEGKVAEAREAMGTRTITALDGTEQEVQSFTEGLGEWREGMEDGTRGLGTATTGMVEGFGSLDMGLSTLSSGFGSFGNDMASLGLGAGDFGSDVSAAANEAVSAAKSLKELEDELAAAREGAEDLSASLEDSSDSFGADKIAEAYEAAGLHASIGIMDMMSQIEGGSHDAMLAEEAKHRLFVMQFGVQVGMFQALIESMEFVSEEMSKLFNDILTGAQEDLKGLLSGEIRVRSGGSGSGSGRGRQRREEAERAREDQLGRLAALEEAAADSGGMFSRELEILVEALELSDELRNAEESARALEAGLTILENGLEDALGSIGSLSDAGSIYDGILEALGDENLTDESRRILTEALSEALNQAGKEARDYASDLADDLAEAIASGDTEEIQRIAEEWAEEFGNLPEGVQEALEQFDERFSRRLRRAMRNATESAIEAAQSSIVEMTVAGGIFAQFDKFKKSIDEQRQAIEQAAISEGRRRRELEKFDEAAAEAVGEYLTGVASSLNSSFQSIASKYAVALDPRELVSLREMEHDLKMVEIRAQIELLVLQGQVAASTAQGWGALLDQIDAAAEANLFMPVDGTRQGGFGGSFSGGVTVESSSDPAQFILDLTDAINDWERSIIGVSNALAEEALDINAKKDEFIQSILDTYSLPNIDLLINQAGNPAVDAILDQYYRILEVAELATRSFVESTLEQFDDIGVPDYIRDLRDINRQFNDINEAFSLLELSASDLADAQERTVEAQRRVLDDFWEKNTSGLKTFSDSIKELTGEGGAGGAGLGFRDLESRFNELINIAQTGTTEERLEAIAELQSDGFLDNLLASGESFFGLGGAEFNQLLERLSIVDDVIAQGIDPEDLENLMMSEDERVQADQLSVLEEIRDALTGGSAAEEVGRELYLDLENMRQIRYNNNSQGFGDYRQQSQEVLARQLVTSAQAGDGLTESTARDLISAMREMTATLNRSLSQQPQGVPYTSKVNGAFNNRLSAI